jgi:hypothetical protein
MTKRTPLEKLEAIKQQTLAVGRAYIESDFVETEKMIRAISDPALSPKQRIKELKKLLVWPRIILGLYKAELAIAQKNKKEKGAAEHGHPSDTALDIVGAAVGLKADRIKDLCKEGRHHVEDQRLPPKPEITAAEFKRILGTGEPENIAAELLKINLERKQQTLSAFEQRVYTAFDSPFSVSGGRSGG